MYNCTVPHLKDLIHICLEPEAQDCGMTFNMCFVLLAQSNPISHYTEANECIFLQWVYM